jgi:ElaB/YqjD/DUF883 family membrane-anchored ribosome-binding protein
MSEGSTGRPDVGAIADDIAALKRDLAALVGLRTKDAVEKGSDAVELLGEEAERLYRNAVAEGKRHLATLVQQVEAQPLTSVLVAFGVGVIAGRLLSR